MKIEDFLTVGKDVHVDNHNGYFIYPEGHFNEYTHEVTDIQEDNVTLVSLENEKQIITLYNFDIVKNAKVVWSFRQFTDFENKKDVENIVPDYYKKGGIDVNEFAERKFPIEQLRGFYRINIIKYVTRYQDKNGVEDLIKAKTYLGKLIELENKEG